MSTMTIIGSGHLARALVQGWDRVTGGKHCIAIVARSENHRDLWEAAQWQSVHYDLNTVTTSEIVVLAVKPQDVSQAVAQLLPYLGEAMVVSAVAGWDLQSLRELGLRSPLARIMPNILSEYGASTTLCTFNGATEEQEQQVVTLLSELGLVMAVDETLMNPYTALLGSGPAYVLLLLDALIETGVALGARRDQTRILVSSMVEGTARMVRDRSSTAILHWISDIASPGGTTEALLKVLGEAQWPDILRTAVISATERAALLGPSAKDY